MVASSLDHEPVLIDDSTILDPTQEAKCFNSVLATVLLPQSSLPSDLECIVVIMLLLGTIWCRWHGHHSVLCFCYQIFAFFSNRVW